MALGGWLRDGEQGKTHYSYEFVEHCGLGMEMGPSRWAGFFAMEVLSMVLKKMLVRKFESFFRDFAGSCGAEYIGTCVSLRPPLSISKLFLNN